MPATRILVTIGALVSVVAVGVWLLGYSPREFRGAGPMRDHGLISYPRYEAPLGELRPDLEGTHTFEFSGLPSEQLSLMLYVEGRYAAHEIARLSTTLEARITDETGTVLCEAAGSPAESDRERRWVLMSSAYEAALWHRRCLDAAYRRRTGYALRVRVVDPDPRSPKVILRAVLEGGGIEMP